MKNTRLLALAISAAWICASPAFVPAAAKDTPAAAAAQQAGEKKLFIFIYRPGPAWRSGVPMKEQGLGPHAKYIKSLLDSGSLLAGGGFADDDGGMAIVTAAGIEEARRMLAADPAITSGIFVGDLEQWRPRFRAPGVLPNLQ
jgi:uncharacterized protein YciI